MQYVNGRARIHNVCVVCLCRSMLIYDMSTRTQKMVTEAIFSQITDVKIFKGKARPVCTGNQSKSATEPSRLTVNT